MIIKKILLIIFIAPFLLLNVYADTSKSSIVMEMNTKRILYQKNANTKSLIASTTKIMTAIITIENTNLDEIVTVGKEILEMYGTNIYIEVGEKIKVKDLLYGLLLRSGNDAAIVLANYVGNKEEKFVEMMNIKAKELGMQNTTFENPHGLDDNTKNYSTAYDMAILSSYANKNKIYRQISKTKNYKTSTTNKSYIWYNRNKLLSQYEHCTGGKNGYTPKAGRTLVTTASKNNMDLTTVTLNDNNEYDTHIELYNKIFSKYKMYKIIDKEKFKISKEIYDGKVSIKESYYYPLTENEKDNITTEIIINKQEPEIIGYINVKLYEKTIGTINIYKQDIKKENQTIFQRLKSYLFEILKKLILGGQNSLKPGPLVPTPPET